MLICRRHCCRHWKLSRHVKPLKMWDFYRIMPVNIKFHISCPYLRFSFFNSLVWYQSREKQLIFVSAITLSMYIYLVGNNTTFATGILFIIFSDICLKGKKKIVFITLLNSHVHVAEFFKMTFFVILVRLLLEACLHVGISASTILRIFGCTTKERTGRARRVWTALYRFRQVYGILWPSLTTARTWLGTPTTRAARWRWEVFYKGTCLFFNINILYSKTISWHNLIKFVQIQVVKINSIRFW